MYISAYKVYIVYLGFLSYLSHVLQLSADNLDKFLQGQEMRVLISTYYVYISRC
jgi:hypothetical protein